MSGTAFTLMIITAISKISGLIREVVFSYFLGSGEIKDIYVTSITITTILFSFIFTAISSGFIPMYHKIESKYGEERAKVFTSNVSNVLIIIATIILVFALVFMEPIVKLVAFGYTGDKFIKAVNFTRITIFIIYFTAFNAGLISFLNIKNDFKTPAAIGIIMNVILILFTVLSAVFHSILILAFGVILANSFKFVFFPKALKKCGYKHRFILNFKDKYLKELLYMAVPIMLSVVATDVSAIIDRTLASTLVSNGGVSSLDYAIKLFSLFHGIITVSIVTATFPRMSKVAQSGNISKLKSVTIDSMTSGFSVLIPTMVMIMLFATPIVRFIYQHGRFTEENTIMTATVFFWYAPGLLGELVKALFVRAFYSIGETKLPVISTILEVCVDVILNFTLTPFIGLNGLALSTTIGVLVGSGYLVYMFRKKTGRLNLKDSVASSLKILISSLISGIIALIIYSLLYNINYAIALIVAIIIAIVIYFILLLNMNIKEFNRLLIDVIKKIENKKRTN